MKTLLFCVLAALAIPALPTMAADAATIDTAINTAMAGADRTQADRDRDAREKPAEVLAFAGVKPGMTVVDLLSGGGYYTELLAGVVGPTGKVYAVNNLPYVNYAKDDIKARFTEGRLQNVEQRVVEASYFSLPPKSADLVIIVMSYHDVYWVNEKEFWPEISSEGFLASIRRVLKPGGKLLIVDHNAAAGTGKEMAGKLHRLNEDWAKKSITSQGFVFEKAYQGLRNPEDKLEKMVYDASIKGKTDRYVHLYKVK